MTSDFEIGRMIMTPRQWLGGRGGGGLGPRKFFWGGCGKGLRGPHACCLNTNAGNNASNEFKVLRSALLQRGIGALAL